MKTLGQRRLRSFVPSIGRHVIAKTTNYEIRSKAGPLVQSFPELVEKVAQLAFHNPEQVLFFRGQSREHTNVRSNTSIKPSIFRPQRGMRVSPNASVLRQRYDRLRQAEAEVVRCFRTNSYLGRERIIRSRILQWAIIQHYEICGTPLLDVTHSLRVAASFATIKQNASSPVVYVIAAPSSGGTITASSEQGVQTIRLSSICPPDARRPYFQEGYLIGEYPDLISFDEKQNYAPHEIDFGLRLLAKFRLNQSTFWNDANYPPIPEAALFPNERDPLYAKSESIKQSLGPE